MVMNGLLKHGQLRKGALGEVYTPTPHGSWLVLFCDEINLPRPDKYGTQEVISFLRQIIEKQGFWKANNVWVSIQNVQVVGSCNPSSDSGRYELDHRFSRYSSVIYMDYPSQASLESIFGAFFESAVQEHLALHKWCVQAKNAMLDLYAFCHESFTTRTQPHYIFSPRELTRWFRGIVQLITPKTNLQPHEFILIWAHEGIRIFYDRLVTLADKEKFWSYLRESCNKHFATIDCSAILTGPLLFSNLMSSDYRFVENLDALTNVIKGKLKLYYEEEGQKEIILFEDSIDHILRINRVFGQIQGHMLLIGISGCGKRTMTRFVAWLNGITFFEPKLSPHYTLATFDDDLKHILIRCGTKDEKICLFLDGTMVNDMSFFERINTLLANSEVTNLFSDAELHSLIESCNEYCKKRGIFHSSNSDIISWFSNEISQNLHVVFSMVPVDNSLGKANASPALYNRCVINWMGDWDNDALIKYGLNSLHWFDNSPRNSDGQVSKDGVSSSCQAISEMFSFVHTTVKSFTSTSRLAYIIAPTQFLEFCQLFSEMYQAKVKDLEFQQRHLIHGLNYLESTFVDVGVLKSDLNAKKLILEKKTIQANDKLKNMVEKQQEAEIQKSKSIDIQAAVSEMNRQIIDRRTKAELELAEVEPALVEAQQAVRSINRKHLTELKSMSNPPAAVKLTMEAVCIFLGYQIDQWKSVQSILKKDDFISSIVNYDTKLISANALDLIQSKYSVDPAFTFESANRASKACGPLLKWVLAQISYSNILEKVLPLRKEILELEKDGNVLEGKLQSINADIDHLGAQIEYFKSEYSTLIEEVQILQSELKSIEIKVQRSISILENLNGEQDRWTESKSLFSARFEAMVGDVLLMAGYLSYCGVFDQKSRGELLNLWKSRLSAFGIKFSEFVSVESFVIESEERARWKTLGLNTDSLSIQNAAMLVQSIRTPYIVDPSGQALEFVKALHGAGKLIVTSFLDSTFTKSLESALRFGTQIVIQDAENLDSVMYPLLRKQFRRIGSRTLCRLGLKEVDVLPSFKLFLFSKSLPTPTSEICSSTSIINFTVTHSSLQSQCLHKIILAVRPDIESKHRDLTRLQGEYQQRLHALEKNLLQVINESSGRILDNDIVLQNLENLKNESQEIDNKLSQAADVLLELEEVTMKFEPLSNTVSTIYFLMDRMQNIDYIYCISLEEFIDSFDRALEYYLESKSSYGKLEQLVLSHLYELMSQSVRKDDILVCGLIVASASRISNQDEREEWNFFLTNQLCKRPNVVDSESIRKAAVQLQQLQSFKRTWSVFERVISDYPALMSDGVVKMLFYDNKEKFISPLQILIFIQCMRPDRLLEGVAHYLNKVLGDWYQVSSHESRMMRKVKVSGNQAKFKPYLIVSDRGSDQSHQLELLAADMGLKTIPVTLGSPESIQLVNSAFVQAADQDCWVIIKNAHLDIGWLKSFELRSQSLNLAKMKVFITMERCDNIPQTLLLNSYVLPFARPAGVWHYLLEALHTIPPGILNIGPVEKHRVFFQLCWFHAIAMDRLRYAPVGWSKIYDFNESDIEVTISIVNNIFDKQVAHVTNINPEQIPWKAIQTIVTENIYGGKVDGLLDKILLGKLVAKYLNVSIFDANYTVYKLHGLEGCRSIGDFINCVKKVSSDSEPECIDLWNSCDDLIQMKKGNVISIVNNLLTNIRSISHGVGQSTESLILTLRNQFHAFLTSIPTVIEINKDH